MKWVIIKGVRYPISVVSAFAAYYGDNPFLKIRIRNKYHIIYFDNMDYLNIQIRYLINNYPDFVQIGNWYISKKQEMSWAALPVEPACMSKVGEGTRRPPMFVGLAEQIKLQCSDIIKVKITI